MIAGMARAAQTTEIVIGIQFLKGPSLEDCEAGADEFGFDVVGGGVVVESAAGSTAAEVVVVEVEGVEDILTVIREN